MKLSLNKVLSRKNLNLAVGLIALMVFLWLISYAIPNLFVQMFDTGLGNLILLGIVGLASMANINLGVGLLIMFFILYRFAHMSGRRFEGATTMAPADPAVDAVINSKDASQINGDIINKANKIQLQKLIVMLSTARNTYKNSQDTYNFNIVNALYNTAYNRYKTM